MDQFIKVAGTEGKVGSYFCQLLPLNENIVYERKIIFISSPISLNICSGCSKETSHQDGSFEYTQHMFWLRNKKKKKKKKSINYHALEPEIEC